MRRQNSAVKGSSGMATRSIHAGMEPDEETRAIKRPLVISNNFAIPPREGYDGAPYAYSRDLSPNACWLEERLLALEGGEDCVVTSMKRF